MGSDVTMATTFWRTCFAEIWISSIICRFNWIVMLGIEYFGNLEHYCFEKYDISDFSVNVWRHWWRHTNFSIRCRLQIVKSGEWRHNSLFLTLWIFLFLFLFIWYILDPIYWNSSHKVPATTIKQIQKYLGVPISANGTCFDVADKLHVTNGLWSPLKPQQRIYCLETHLVPALHLQLVLAPKINISWVGSIGALVPLFALG